MISRSFTTVAHRLADGLSQPLPLDAYRELVDPLWSRRPRATITAIEPLSDGAVRVVLRPNRAWPDHTPGQFVTIGIDIDGVRHHRCYSVTSPGRGQSSAGALATIELGVRLVDGGLVSNHMAHVARVGDLVHLDGPTGDFVLPRPLPAKLLFVTGGSGITPVMAMLRSLAVTPDHGADVVVLHHAPTPEQTMYAVELGALALTHPWLHLRITHTADRDAADRDAAGRLDADGLDERCPDWRERVSFVCGPASLLDFATDRWADAGVLDRLHVERFTGPMPARSATDVDAPTDDDAAVAFAASSVTVASATESTLLDTAEAAGVTAPAGCRVGVCHTCSTRLIAGTTRDVRDGRTSDAGAHVQLCVSRAVGPVTLDL